MVQGGNDLIASLSGFFGIAPVKDFRNSLAIAPDDPTSTMPGEPGN
jgi:hypothetical protein